MVQLTPSNGYVRFPYHPLVRLIGPSVSACDHRLQKIFGAANVDLGLVSSGEARANQTQVNISPPKFFVRLVCVTRTKYPLNLGSCCPGAVVPRGQLSTWAVVAWAVVAWAAVARGTCPWGRCQPVIIEDRPKAPTRA